MTVSMACHKWRGPLIVDRAVPGAFRAHPGQPQRALPVVLVKRRYRADARQPASSLSSALPSSVSSSYRPALPRIA